MTKALKLEFIELRLWLTTLLLTSCLVRGVYEREYITDYNKEHLAADEDLSSCEYICEIRSAASAAREEAAGPAAASSATGEEAAGSAASSTHVVAADEAGKLTSSNPVVSPEEAGCVTANTRVDTAPEDADKIASSSAFSDMKTQLKKICRRGCRLFVIVASLDNFTDFEETKEACSKSCMEAYTVTDELTACQLGCHSQLPNGANNRNQGEVLKHGSTSTILFSLSPFLYAHNAFGNMVDKVVEKKGARRLITWSYYQQSEDGRMVVVRSSDFGRGQQSAGGDKMIGIGGGQEGQESAGRDKIIGDERIENILIRTKKHGVSDNIS